MLIIKTYQGRLGKVFIYRFAEGGQCEYKVQHELAEIRPCWYRDKRDAIVHAQFLAGKY